MTQFYLVRVQKLMTSEDMDVVPGWSAYIAEDKLSALDLTKAAEICTLAIRGAPVPDLRPMTEDEIKKWRADEGGDDE